MINFASLFNQFRMGGGNSSINELIENPNTSIGRLLDQDSFVNELKSGNAKVNEYMKYDKYETLVDFVTKVGPEDDRKRSYKYPMSACDVLSSDSQAPIEFFFPDRPIILTEELPHQEEPASESPKQVADPNAKVTTVDNIDDTKEEADKPEASQEANTDSNQKESTPVDGAQEQNATTETPSKVETQKEETKEVKVVQREARPLSNKLFQYFEGEVNYTLAGYVSKIFGSFLSKKPTQVLKFLLEETRFAEVLKHIESRSVSQLVVKLLTHESGQFLEERKKNFDAMLNKASQKEEIYTISNLSASICEIIEKVAGALKGNSSESASELSTLYFKPQIITKVITNVMSDEENISVYNAPILSTYLTNVPLILPENDQLVDDLKNLLQGFLGKALEKLKVTRSSRRTLGFGRVKIVEIMSFVLKQNILQCQDLAANEPEFFLILFSLCQNYQLNNVLHNEVVKIIEIALAQSPESPFLQALLKDEVLLKFLTDETNEDMKIKAGEGSQKVRKGYIGHIVQICRKVQQSGQKNTEVKKLVDSKGFDYILENLVNREVFENSKNLAGYGMNKREKNTILFMKEEVIQQHLKFLMETPAPVYEPEPEHTNIEHPDLVEAEHQQLQNPANACDLLAREVAEEKEVIEEETQEIDPKFWVGHINYDLELLMNDL